MRGAMKNIINIIYPFRLKIYLHFQLCKSKTNFTALFKSQDIPSIYL